MMLSDYVIPQDAHDWGELLSPWHDLVPAGFDLWMVTRIGDAIMVYDDGSVHLLDVGSASVSRLAGSRDDFVREVDRGSNADRWFAIPLVDALVAAGESLEDGQCYGFVRPPILGGEYAPANVRRVPLAEHYTFLGRIHERTRHLADGTRVTVRRDG